MLDQPEFIDEKEEENQQLRADIILLEEDMKKIQAEADDYKAKYDLLFEVIENIFDIVKSVSRKL